MKRRQFLGASAAAAGAPLLSALAPARAGSEQAAPVKEPALLTQADAARLRKAAKYGMIAEGASVLDKFRIARAAGFEGIELDSPSELNLDEVLEARHETGIAIPGVVDSVHWRQTLSDPDANVRAEGRRALETALRDCKRYGGTSVLLVPAVVNERVAYDAAYARSQAEIRKLLPLAAELQIHIAIENVWNNFLLSPLEAARYTDELDSPWIGWHFDVGNIVNYGWPEQWIRVLRRRIIKLDIKEYSRKKRDDEGLWKGFNVEIGDGDCNWPAVMKALDDIGYRGWACAEVGGGDAKRLRDIATRMDRIFSS